METKQAQHTPGPWKADGTEIYNQDGNLVAGVAQQMFVSETRESDESIERANARLIAAAPDYHAAVEAMFDGAISSAADKRMAVTFDAWNALMAAHIKAEGKPDGA